MQQSQSPILYLQISKSFLQGFDILWRHEFADKNSFHWDRSLIFHPISQLLGLSLETATKGLLACRMTDPPKIHDLQALFLELNDAELENDASEAIKGLDVPADLIEMNPEKTLEELSSIYRTHEFHLHLLNNIYDRPFASRYPVLGGFALPNPLALSAITRVLQGKLETESRNWAPES